MTTTPSSLDITFNEAAIEDVKALEYVPESAITDAASALAWYQTDPESDSDNDGVTDGDELYFGTDLLGADQPIVEILTIEPLVLGVSRSVTASPDLPSLYSSEDMITWDLVSPVSFEILPLDAFRDQIQMEIPAIDPELESGLFYSVAAPD